MTFCYTSITTRPPRGGRQHAHHRDRDLLLKLPALLPACLSAELLKFSVGQACVCVFITAVPIIKLFAWGEGDSGGHVLRETTSRGLCGLVCPSRTSERRGEGIIV